MSPKKEYLIRKINEVVLENAKDRVNGHTVNVVEYIADFIIKEQKFIVDPLIKEMSLFNNPNPNINVNWLEAVKATLELAKDY